MEQMEQELEKLKIILEYQVKRSYLFTRLLLIGGAILVFLGAYFVYLERLFP